MYLSEDSIINGYKAMLGRSPTPTEVKNWMTGSFTVEQFYSGTVRSTEFIQYQRLSILNCEASKVDIYGPPVDLRVTETPIKRVLLVGQCLLDNWIHILSSNSINIAVDRLLLTAEEISSPPCPFEAYSYQISHIPVRSVIHDHDLFKLIRMGFNDPTVAEEILATARIKLRRIIAQATRWSSHFPVFVTNLPVPLEHGHGRTINYLNNCNLINFFNEVNKEIAKQVQEIKNVYLLNIDSILQRNGRKFIQDDILGVSTHGSVIANHFHEEDGRRLIKLDKPVDYFTVRESEFVLAVWREAEAALRTILQIDQVKMICVDLDDTLWRGVLAEEADLNDIDVETAIGGWPTGLAEALLTLKSRGIMLSIISKNSEDRIRQIFKKLYSGKITIDDFAFVKANWKPKTENIREVMLAANILPNSVVFLDDNPVERSAVKTAYPQIRIIEAPPYYWKKILIGSSETQVAFISDESARRTEMVKAQVERDELRKQVSHEEFLMSLELSVRLYKVATGTKSFDRALELINKSNQFNTTGKRWTAAELKAIVEGGALIVASVVDKYTDYGITFVAIVLEQAVVQIVMSCRVISLGVELSALSKISEYMMQMHPTIQSSIVATDANLLSRDLFDRAGWEKTDDGWRTSSPNRAPMHVSIENELDVLMSA